MQEVGAGLRSQIRLEKTEDDAQFKARQQQMQQEGQELAKILSAESCQHMGNEAFKNKDFDKAIKSYTKALRKLGAAPRAEESARATQVACLTNRAACRLKVSPPDVDGCADDCCAALEIDATNVKALFRRGTAFGLMGGMDAAAIGDMEAALVLKPDDKGIRSSLDRLKRRVAKESVATATPVREPDPE